MSNHETPRDEALKDLNRRADALERRQARPDSAAASHGAAANQAYKLVADLLGGVILGVALGFGLDRVAPMMGLRTAPAGLIGGVLLGFAVSVWMAKNTADRLVAQAKRENPNPPSVSDDADDD